MQAVLNKAVVGDGAPKKMEEALLGNGQAVSTNRVATDLVFQALDLKVYTEFTRS